MFWLQPTDPSTLGCCPHQAPKYDQSDHALRLMVVWWASDRQHSAHQHADQTVELPVVLAYQLDDGLRVKDAWYHW